MHSGIPRPEHPRPDFRRDEWLNLNGTWQFAFDDDDRGMAEGWWRSGHALEREIVVPFCYQCKASGIGDEGIHPILWYRRAFTVPHGMLGRRVLLRFGAVDDSCRVYVNGQQVGQHEGGYLPFAIDITHALCEGENDLCLRVEDTVDCAQPRGKQYWKEGVMGCWYVPVSGIWQTVYLEAAGEQYLRTLHVTPDVDAGTACFELELEQMPQKPLQVTIDVACEGARWQASALMTTRRVTVPVSLRDGERKTVHQWLPWRPALHEACVTLKNDDHLVDSVHTYFGMRNVQLKDGVVLINHQPIYQRLVLDQGYWPDTLLTPPSEEAIRADVEATLKLGYNGARKHQKIEDPLYYYWASKLGLLVWGELPSPYAFCHESTRRLSETFTGFVHRDYNHPCIICWTPLNESWGVDEVLNDPRQQAFARMLYQQAKAMDGTRLVSGNDGWEQVETDICALHDYAADGDALRMHFATRQQVEEHGADFRLCWANAHARRGDEAFLITEYGGIAMVDDDPEVGGMQTWGYNGKEKNEEAFLARFESLTDAIRQLPYCQGYCYTQLTDVMQETNGVLTADRKPKVDMERFAAINRKKR